MKRTSDKIKHLLRAMVAMTMAVAVLLQFGFVSINSMTCLVSGNQMVSVGELDDCCASDCVPQSSIDSECCDFEVNSKTFDVYKKADGPLLEMPVMTAVFEAETLLVPCTKTVLNCTWLANPPPILNGVHLLVFISKFSL